MENSVSLIQEADFHFFNEGTHARLYDKLGAHIGERDGVAGVWFSVWAPNADYVSVIGSFNDWNSGAHPLAALGGSGVWEAFVPGAPHAALYKYHIHSRASGQTLEKTDPMGAFHEIAPKFASIVWDLKYEWNDAEWMKDRWKRNALDAPISIYEVHLGSWMRVPEEGNRSLSYREMAPKLAAHVKSCGFTHVEFLPIMEHPLFASWGYQVTGYFAPCSRFGTPQDFMYLTDYLHQQGIGVILDWVPSHFPTDAHGLANFDGTHLYEHADMRQGFHPDWKSAIFNYGRNEVRSFLLSSALFWLDRYHADGLRVDGVASMLYLDYSRKEGEWIPNKYGGKENLEAISFLKLFNETIYREFPDVQTYAEESTSWPMVSRPLYVGGLGFGSKWDMGWMHDMLQFMGNESIHRKYHHNNLTFRMLYAFTENFTLPLSHDEVVHGKGSLIARMPGDAWQKLANLRLLYAYMYAQPGKKLLFMGAEIGQWSEWDHDGSVEWHLLNDPGNGGVKKWIEDLNRAYASERALHELDFSHAGFEWLDCSDWEQSIISFLRKGKSEDEIILAVFNFTPVPRTEYRIGVPLQGFWKEILCSDATIYGGSGYGNFGGMEPEEIPCHGRPYSLRLTLPPLGAAFFKFQKMYA